jgi:HK97 gp10 family phage protein
VKTTFEFSGGREMEQQLLRLKAGTAKGASRRALRKAAKPMADQMAASAPRLSGALSESVAITSKLSPTQAAMHRRMFPGSRYAVELHVGPGPHPQGVLQEFGTETNSPQPFVRPTWDADNQALLERLKDEMWSEITKTIARGIKRGTVAE